MIESIEETVRQFLIEQFTYGSDVAMPAADESLNEAGVIDSAGVLSLVLFLEETFGITVDDSDVHPDNLDSITNLASFVRRKQALVDERK